MKSLRKPSRKTLLFAEALFIYTWLSNLAKTDSYYSVYMLCAIAGLCCIYDNSKTRPMFSKQAGIWVAVFSALFSLAPILANYFLFEPFTALISLFNLGCCFLGGFFIAGNILLCLLNRLPLAADDSLRKHSGWVFLFPFLTVSVLDLMYLLFAAYPGVLTTDSVSTMEQIVSGIYNNTMPFWHTMTVKLFYEIGYLIFGEVNAAVAFFQAAQILFLAACFAYALMTLYQAGVPKWCLALVYVLYAFLPYNIVYSVTMWKDVLFGGAVLLFVTSLYRILRGIGSSQIRSYVFFALGGIGLSLWRTNGWYAFLVTTIVMLILLRKQYKTLLLILCAVLVLCWILINPLLSALNVSGTDRMEALAVPFQQVARVIANDRELTEGERELLSEAFWLDRVQELYTPETVDPVKFEAFRHDNRDYVEQHLWDYAKLYVRLGLRYPGDYLKAWIEETKGYWNGGYFFWIYTKGVDTNNLGIVSSGGGNIISSLFAAAFRFLEQPGIFQPLYSIGLCVWLILGSCLLNIWRKRKEFLLTIPVIVLIVGLWLGTPVYAEFRYAYPFFLTMPVILAATLFPAKQTVQP
ncbi:MAG: DUF6020 family protein [Faecousia sp.]